jgi:hypothetical protein
MLWLALALAILLPWNAAGAQALQPVAPPDNVAPAPAKTSSTATTVSKTHPAVEMIPLAAPAEITGRKSSYTFKVTNSEWMDTGVQLAAGDHLVWSASGTMTIGDGREVTPDGLTRGWKDLIRQFPANNANTGALVARIGDAEAVPFLIGTKKDLEISQTGKLYLAANLSSDLTATGGAFEVKIKFAEPVKAQGGGTKNSASEKLVAGDAGGSAGASTTASMDSSTFQSQLSPALFADIPRRVADQQGTPGDMVNFTLLGTEDQVSKAFAAAGWIVVDKTTQDAVLHGVLATLQHKAYVEMPMSTLYLFGRPQDLSYARAAPLEVAAVRHHLRVWKTTKTVGGKTMWVGSATHDNGFEEDQRTGGVTHHIDANIDEERDFIQKSFASAGVISNAAYVMPENPLRTANTATGGTFESDGRIVVMELN